MRHKEIRYIPKDLEPNEAKFMLDKDKAYRKSMELSNDVFVKRLWAELERMGRRVPKLV